jgi:hypothetical protein
MMKVMFWYLVSDTDKVMPAVILVIFKFGSGWNWDYICFVTLHVFGGVSLCSHIDMFCIHFIFVVSQD